MWQCSQSMQTCSKLLLYSGEAGVTLADVRATHCHTHKTCLPHEVKAPWVEGCSGGDFSELFPNAKGNKAMPRPAAQVLYYVLRPCHQGYLHFLLQAVSGHASVYCSRVFVNKCCPSHCHQTNRKLDVLSQVMPYVCQHFQHHAPL